VARPRWLRREGWKWAFLALAVAAPIELVSYAAGLLLAGRGLVYRARVPQDYEEYLGARDTLLGWPSPAAPGSGEIDRSGSRLVPSFPDPDRTPCVALFGDSFTFGFEVPPEHAYGNVLAELLGCRVANYGVGGYGTDQSFLRFRDRIRDGAPVAVLGHLAENAIRNVNRYRGFLTGLPHGFKPRLLLGERGELELVPLPTLTREQLADVDRRPELLPHEFFRPGGDSGVVALRFPYSRVLLGVPFHYRVRAQLAGRVSYAEFYAPDHPSGALPLTLAILEEFVRVAERRGQRGLVLVIPEQGALRELRESGALPYAPLTAALAEAGIATPPIAERMLAYLGGRDPCELFTSCRAGHFTREGYRLLAQIAFDFLRESGLPPPDARATGGGGS
jgi:hypothetical protein